MDTTAKGSRPVSDREDTEDDEEQNQEELDMAIANAAGEWLALMSKISQREQLIELRGLIADMADLTDAPIVETMHRLFEEWEMLEADTRREMRNRFADALQKRFESLGVNADQAHDLIAELHKDVQKMI